MEITQNTGTLMRLNQFLSQAGVASRRSADALIEKGNVKVNGKLIKKLGTKIDPLNDTVEVMDQRSNIYAWKQVTQVKEKVTIALYKPKGFVTSMKKQGSAPIISSLVPRNRRLFPVGRLDRDSEGLLLLTNDGDLSQQLMHPKKHINKTYRVTAIIPKDMTENELKGKLGRLAKGIKIQNQQTLPSVIQLERFEETRHRAILLITLQEGKNRQIRRMLGSINLEVLMLVRISIGQLTLEQLELAPKEYSSLTQEHISSLFQ